MSVPSTEIVPVVLCGGSGTRLWPLSNKKRPKQFLPLIGEKSMLSETLARVEESAASSIHLGRPLVIGSVRHEKLLIDQAPAADFILEPFGRNSAPAIAAAALAAPADTLLLVLPADHHIRNTAAFHAAIETGAQAANAGHLVTFGILPTHAATGYGYIRTGEALGAAAKVEAFVEKPDLETAESYVSSGRYFWNAGIFLFRAGDMLTSLERFCPEILAAVRAALPAAGPQIRHLDADAFGRSPSDSIDYAVMEKADNVAVVSVDMGWSDIGDYRALKDSLAGDAAGTAAHGDVIAIDAANCYLKAERGIVAAIGVENLAIVSTGDAVLVTSLDRTQDVKKVVNLLDERGLTQPGLVTSETLARVKGWLFNEALPFWSENGLDRSHGGFHERLTLDGRPKLDDDYRRLRVQARQIYCFAHAHLLGWDGPALDTMWAGYEFLTAKGWRGDGGWLHLFTPDGGVKDGQLDAYDQAFVMLAMAWMHKATGDKAPLDWVARTLDVMDSKLGDPILGGYFDADPNPTMRRANPHMHMLEAMMALYEATGDKTYIDRAGAMIYLFERHFFDPATDTLTEFFAPDWSIAASEEGRWTDPGHHYEWAWLLWRYQVHTGHDLRSHIHRLIRFADRFGREPNSGFAMDMVWKDGTPLQTTRRCWPQTEMLKARIAAPDLVEAGAIDDLTNALLDEYLSGVPAGTWMDQFDAEGRPVAETIPASTFYHLLFALAQLIDPPATA